VRKTAAAMQSKLMMTSKRSMMPRLQKLGSRAVACSSVDGVGSALVLDGCTILNESSFLMRALVKAGGHQH